jgi:hypothetical protein
LLISSSANAGRLPLGPATAESLVDPALLLQYQGRLLDPVTGGPKPDGSYQMILRLYDAASGGSLLWSETKDVTVMDGLFTTFLGDTTALDLSDFDGQPLWLSVTVGADPEATPRQRVAHVAYALHAEDADTVDGQEATEFAAVAHNHAAADITSGALDYGRFSAYGDLQAEGKIGSGSGQVAAGGHDHDAGDIASGALSTDRFSAHHDLQAEGKIGSSADQVAVGNHTHDGRYYTETESDSRFVNDNSNEVGNADVANGALSASKIAGTAWTSSNDGANSGLDADRLDGYQASSFAGASHSHSGLPVAFAFIGSDGEVDSGTSNVSSVWNGSLDRYEITISGHSYFWTSYVTVVTPSSTCGTAVAGTGSISGRLTVQFSSSSGSKQCAFQFVTFRP